ncbi:MAG: hypothetical protein ACD_75C01913G0002, partial [uncultured bacterium]
NGGISRPRCPYNLPTNETVIKDLLDNNRLTAHFQPIVSLQQAKVFAYEALCRIVDPNPFDNIEELFHQARICGRTLQLDMRCRQNGLALAAAQGLNDREALLFLNICPTSLLHPDHSAGTTGILANKYSIPKHTIVLEIASGSPSTTISASPAAANISAPSRSAPFSMR